jgi:hypothetical protein
VLDDGAVVDFSSHFLLAALRAERSPRHSEGIISSVCMQLIPEQQQHAGSCCTDPTIKSPFTNQSVLVAIPINHEFLSYCGPIGCHG